MRNLIVSLWVFLLIAACGGGSGSAPVPAPPPPPSATATDLANARTANLSAALDLATKVTTLQWTDSFPAGTAYGIEQASSSGTWSAIDSVPGTTGSGATLVWTRTTNATTTLRVAAQKTGYEVPINTPSGNNSVQITVPASTPTLQIDQAQPLNGVVTLSIAGGGSYAAVMWTVDLQTLGSSSSGPGYSVPWDTHGVTAGSHLILARLETAPDSYLELRLTVQVANPAVAVQVGVSGTSGAIYANVTASSAVGITAVSAALDGQALGTLNAPNCTGMGCGATYQFPIDATAAGSGVHTVSATATDGNGVSASASTTVTFSNPPTLTVTAPLDGALVNGTLSVAGAVTTDKAATTVSVSATLGSVPVLSTTAARFSADFSLAGVVPGTYTLTVTATDSSGQSRVVANLVTVTSTPALVYTPVFALGVGGSLLAVNGSTVLYSGADGRIHLHTSAADTDLLAGAVTNLSGWQVADNGAVFAQGFGTDRPGGAVSIYLWPPGSTTATNLSNAAQSTSIYDQLLPAHYPWVLWASLLSSHWSQYTLYNVVSGQTLIIPGPPGITLVGNNHCDFVSSNGQLSLFYWTESQSANQQYTTDLYRWDQSNNASVPLTSDGLSLYPQTDGTRVAWQTDRAPPPPNAPYGLRTLALGSNTVTSLSANMVLFELSAGLLGWLDQTIAVSGTGVSTVTAQAIRASDGVTTSTLSNLLGASFLGSSGGYVAFEESAQLYVWSPAGGKTLLFEAAPGQVHLSGTSLYFTNGNRQALYSVPMH